MLGIYLVLALKTSYMQLGMLIIKYKQSPDLIFFHSGIIFALNLYILYSIFLYYYDTFLRDFDKCLIILW